MKKKILLGFVSVFVCLLMLVGPVFGQTAEVNVDNNPPNKPLMDGPTKGTIDKEIEFTVLAIDPDGDKVSFFIDWNDGTSTWTDYYDSNTPVTVSHTWHIKGAFDIRCKARDIYEADSDISHLYFSIRDSKQTLNDDIEFPLENGPYNIFIGGKWCGSFQKPLTAKKGLVTIGPFIYSIFIITTTFFLYQNYVLIVDGIIQNINISTYPIRMDVSGFKGFHPGLLWLMTRFGFGLSPVIPRLRCFGTCDAIDLI